MRLADAPAAVLVSLAWEGRDKMMKAERKPEGSREETALRKVVALDAGRRHVGGRNG